MLDQTDTVLIYFTHNEHFCLLSAEYAHSFTKHGAIFKAALVVCFIMFYLSPSNAFLLLKD